MNNIESVIKKLKEQGVDEGKSEADKIIAKANSDAALIIENAERKANQILEDAKKRADDLQNTAKSAMAIAGKKTVHTVALRISEMLEAVLKEKIKEKINSENVIKKIIAGEKADLKELLPFIRDKIKSENWEIKFADKDKIIVGFKDENYHYEISDETMISVLKTSMREELHHLIFPNER